jgi:hypothetical protein
MPRPIVQKNAPGQKCPFKNLDGNTYGRAFTVGYYIAAKNVQTKRKNMIQYGFELMASVCAVLETTYTI